MRSMYKYAQRKGVPDRSQSLGLPLLRSLSSFIIFMYKRQPLMYSSSPRRVTKRKERCAAAHSWELGAGQREARSSLGLRLSEECCRNGDRCSKKEYFFAL